MKLFASLYAATLRASAHPKAVWYLCLISFLESWVFPIPTSVILAPLVLANPAAAWRLAGLTTFWSVAGGLFGYAIGYFLFAQIGQGIVDFYDATAAFAELQGQFARYGAWFVVIAGVSPIPYKLVTIGSGVLQLPVMVFLVASVIGRAAQFFVVAGLIWWGGEALQRTLKRYTEAVGWGLVVLVVVGVFWYGILG